MTSINQDADADGSGSVDFTEFVELMIKREAEKETPEDLKQAFRVFDKVVLCTLYSVLMHVILSTTLIVGWKWIRKHL